MAQDGCRRGYLLRHNGQALLQSPVGVRGHGRGPVTRCENGALSFA